MDDVGSVAEGHTLQHLVHVEAESFWLHTEKEHKVSVKMRRKVFTESESKRVSHP